MSALMEKMGFAKKLDVKEQMRESQREIRKGTRDIEREVLDLQREEKKVILEIKAAAKTGNQAATRILAKNLVRLRGQITKLHSSKAQLKGVGVQMTTAASTATVAKAVGSAAKTMSVMNTAISPAKINQTLQNFAKENAKMDMANEMVGDAMDDALDNDEVEGETDDLVNQVLDSIGVDVAASMQSAPNRRVGVAQGRQQQEAEGEEEMDDDLVARLANLKS